MIHQTKAIISLFVLASAGVLAAQRADVVITYPTGFGQATENDRSSAMDEATQNATNQANATCIGTVTETNTTSSNCFQTGPDGDGNYTYACTVTVKARCEFDRSK